MRINIGLESLSDGVLLTRLLVFIMLAWPLLATLLVYAFRRSRITRPGAYFLRSTLTGYAVCLLGPLVLLVLFFLLGQVPEVAVFYTIVLSVPLFAPLALGVAVYWSRRK